MAVLSLLLQPVVVTAGEIEEVVAVPIGEVTGPVPPIPQPGRVGLVVVPVALEAGTPGLGDHFADGLFGIEQPTVSVEVGPRALLAGLGVEDHGAGQGPAQ